MRMIPKVCLALKMAFATATGTLLAQPAPQRGTLEENSCQTKDKAELLGKRGPCPFQRQFLLLLPTPTPGSTCQHYTKTTSLLA